MSKEYGSAGAGEYVHFSGHDSQIDDRSGEEFDTPDESIQPRNALTGKLAGITGGELRSIFCGYARATIGSPSIPAVRAQRFATGAR